MTSNFTCKFSLTHNSVHLPSPTSIPRSLLPPCSLSPSLRVSPRRINSRLSSKSCTPGVWIKHALIQTLHKMHCSRYANFHCYKTSPETLKSLLYRQHIVRKKDMHQILFFRWVFALNPSRELMAWPPDPGPTPDGRLRLRSHHARRCLLKLVFPNWKM